jgi:hypothetical protein
MESVDFVICIVVDDLWVNEVWLSFCLPVIERFESVEGETTRETSHCAKQTLESLGEGVTDIIFIDLPSAMLSGLVPESWSTRILPHSANSSHRKPQ